MIFIKKIICVDRIIDAERKIISYSDKIVMNNEIIFKDKIYFTTLFKKSLMIAVKNGENSYLMDLNNLKCKFFAKIGVIDFFIDVDKVLYGTWNDDYSQRNVKAFDLTLEQELWNMNYTFGLVCLECNSLYATIEKNISKIEKLTGNSLWQFSNLSDYNWMQKSIYEDEPPYEKEAEAIKFLGVYKDLLWVVLNGGSLLALDINTGEVKRYIYQGKPKEAVDKILDNATFSIYSFIDEKDGKIINLFHDFYLEYDLEKLNDFFEYSTFTESTKKFGLELDKIGGYDEDYIYSYEGSDNNRFAVFCRYKKEIIWSGEIEEVKGKFPAIRDLQYGANKLYVLDHDHTLHVFEREQNL